MTSSNKFRANFLNFLQKEFEICCFPSAESVLCKREKIQLINLVIFIGELFKLRQLTDEIVVDCIYNLIMVGSSDDENQVDHLELGVKLLSTAGPCLYLLRSRHLSKKLALKIVKCFEMLEKLLSNCYECSEAADRPGNRTVKLNTRLKFLIKDLIDLKSVNKYNFCKDSLKYIINFISFFF